VKSTDVLELLIVKVRIGGAEPYPTYKLEVLTYLFKRHLAIVAKQREYFYVFIQCFRACESTKI